MPRYIQPEFCASLSVSLSRSTKISIPIGSDKLYRPVDLDLLGRPQLTTSSTKDNDDDPAAIDWDSDLWLTRLPGDSPSLASSAVPASISPSSPPSGPVEESSSCSFCSSRICRVNTETKMEELAIGQPHHIHISPK